MRKKDWAGITKRQEEYTATMSKEPITRESIAHSIRREIHELNFSLETETELNELLHKFARLKDNEVIELVAEFYEMKRAIKDFVNRVESLR